MGDEEELDRVEASIAAHKGWLTKRQAACERAREFVETNPTSYAVKELEDGYGKFKETCDKLQELYCRVQTLAGLKSKVGDQAVIRLDQLEKQEEAVARHVHQCLANARVAPTQDIAQAPRAQGAAAAQGGRQRVNEALRPKTLTKEWTPSEFRSWVERFKSYYNTSAMEDLRIGDQHTYLYSVLDTELEEAVKGRIDATTPMFDTQGRRDSCIKALQEEFQWLYPTFNRRMSYFNLTQPAGQSMADWVRQVKKTGTEADLVGLTMDDLHVFKIITGCSDEGVKQKLLDRDQKTLRNVENEAYKYDSDSRVMAGNKGGSTTAQAAKVTSKKGKKQNQKKGQTSRKPRIPEDLRGKCLCCGKPGHTGKACKAKGNLKCQKCNKEGHIAEVCLTSYHSTPSSRPASRYSSPAPSRSPSPTPSRTALIRTEVRQATGKSRPTPKLQVHFCKGETSFVFPATPDTGATRTFMAYNLARKYNLHLTPLHRDEKFYTASGASMRCEGTIKLKASAGDAVCYLDTVVSSELSNEVLLSWHDLIALGVIEKNFPNTGKACQVISNDNLENIKKDYTDVLANTLGNKTIHGEPMRIQLKKDVDIKPLKSLTARPTPIHWKEGCDEHLDELLANESIEPVNHVTRWISPGFFVPKEGGKRGYRLVTDFTKLNQAVERPVHPFPATRDCLNTITPDSKYFAKLDAVQGYFQIPLAEESRDLTTFIVPRGKFRYKVAPMGLNSSNDEFCARTDPAVAGYDWAVKIVDDILLQAPDLSTLLKRIRLVLDRCRELGITISLKKLEVGQKIKFAGHIVSADGVQPDPEKTQAITDFPAPKNLTELRSFLGLANQLANFVPDLTQMTSSMRQLLKKSSTYNWLPDHQLEFEKVKTLLTSDLLVKPFDPSLPTELLTDASRLYGLGFLLWQRDGTNTPRIVHCGSVALTDAQRNYAVVELELLAVQWAIQKCSFYLRGMKTFTVITDHRPLVGIFAKDLHAIENTRLLRLRMKLTEYSFTVQWRAGKLHAIADALSRAPVFAAEDDETMINVDGYVKAIIASDPSLNLFLQHKETSDYFQLKSAIANNEDLSKIPVEHPARAYTNIWDRLSVNDDGLVLLDGERIVVPQPARQEVLRLLHLPHGGIVKTRQQANRLYYWPGMSSDVKNITETCEECNRCRASLPKQVNQEQSKALGPMTHVATDLFDFKGSDYLVLVDRYSGFFFVERLKKTTTADVTKKLRDWFLEHGFPTVIRSDGGPQYRSNFDSFCTSYNITHETTSPYNPQSNGLAESAVKNAKYLLKKCTNEGSSYREALLEWRNLPRADGLSPAELFFGRRQKTQLPTFANVADNQMASKREETLLKKRTYDDNRAHKAPKYSVDEKVWILNTKTGEWDTTGIIIAYMNSESSYKVETEHGVTIWRTGRFLRSCRSFTPPLQKHASIMPTPCADPAPRRSERLKVRFSARENKKK